MAISEQINHTRHQHPRQGGQAHAAYQPHVYDEGTRMSKGVRLVKCGGGRRIIRKTIPKE